MDWMVPFVIGLGLGGYIGVYVRLLCELDALKKHNAKMHGNE